MPLTKKELVGLAVSIANQDVPNPTQYSISDMKATLLEEIQAMAGDFNSYRRNKLDLFELMQETVDTVLPNRVFETVGRFAEVQNVAQGQKATFKRKMGQQRAKQFVTRVGLSGHYETFRLDQSTFDVTTTAFGGAALIELERMLDGQEDFAEYIQIMMDGLEECVYKEILRAMQAVYATLPANNRHTAANFDSAEMRRIIRAVSTYGSGATILCFPTFAATIEPETKYIGDPDKADMRNKGYIGTFFGSDVLVLPNSFTDETNTEYVFDEDTAFILPTGGPSEKLVKIVFEGNTIIDEVANRDWSREIQAYKKLGVSLQTANHIGMYKNTSL